jgi:hypothetical protein
VIDLDIDVCVVCPYRLNENWSDSSSGAVTAKGEFGQSHREACKAAHYFPATDADVIPKHNSGGKRRKVCLVKSPITPGLALGSWSPHL